MKKVSKKSAKKKAGKFKIEVVDDHVQTVISLCQYLDNSGFETIQAYNGKEAIDMANKENPDLIVLDIRMEGLSGYDVAAALPKKKILFMSGFGFEDTKVNSFKNSIGFMEKPINLKEMVSTIKKALNIKSEE